VTTTEAIRAADVVRADTAAVTPETRLREALEIMERQHVSGLPVIEPETRRVVGVVCRPLAAYAVPAEENPGFEVEPVFYRDTVEPETEAPSSDVEAQVAEAMSPVVIDIPANTPIDRLARLLVDLELHRVLVVEDGALLGHVEALDLVALIADGRLVVPATGK